MNPAKIALIDDHNLLRSGLAELINSFPGYRVTMEVGNGRELTQRIDPADLPDLALLDINMPIMDGFATAEWLSKNHPAVKVLALSMDDNETSIIRMLKCGARGYVLKDAETSEFRIALDTVIDKGFYHSEMVANTLMHALHKPVQRTLPKSALNPREIEFLKLVCTGMTYKEIADKMCLSARTVDGYREDLFVKLNVKNRVGLAIYAIQQGIVTID
ncbi:MAG: response regulator transcription factor [Cytophagaceae bacterium]|nr:response regulator transcription factor [Cytophagaceae bacterium]